MEEDFKVTEEVKEYIAEHTLKRPLLEREREMCAIPRAPLLGAAHQLERSTNCKNVDVPLL